MRLYFTLLVVVAFLAAACGGGDVPAADPTAPPSDAAPLSETAVSEPAGGTTDTDDDAAALATVGVAGSSEGRILVDGEGMTLYLFTNDGQGASTCYDECEGNWPPLEGPAAAGDGADDSLLGTVERDDGTQQVTYNSWPLYYYAADSKPGDVNGQGVGDVWFAVDPDGEAVASGGGDDDGDRDY